MDLKHPIIAVANVGAAVFFTGWIAVALARKVLKEIWS